MSASEFDRFVSETGLETCRRGFAEELLLFAYFDARTVAGASAGEVFERRFEGEPLLLDRETAVGVGFELCAAGADYDGGEPEEER